MTFRTYLPGLVLVLRAAHRYATKYQQQLSGTLSAPQYTCLVSTIQALADCLALITLPATED
jgi:hypothetical protein